MARLIQNGLSTAVHFEYGTTINYGSSTAIQNYSGSTAQDVIANLSSLIAGRDVSFPNRSQQCRWNEVRH